MQQKLDVAEVLKYPLTLVPLCLSHVSGSVNSTPRSNLLNHIDSQFVTVSPPSSINATIIEAAFYLHLQINPPDTFGGIARSFLNQIMGYSGNVIYFVADKWLTPSITNIEHIEQDAVWTTYKISEPSQKKKPTDLEVALKISSFKESLVEFFVKTLHKKFHGTFSGTFF